METARRLRRGSRKTKKELSFELVDIKTEPDEASSDELYGSAEASSARKVKKRYTRTRAVQVKSEDIDDFAVTRVNVPSICGENEPIDPVYGETIVPQCRFCLRRVSRGNLKIILTKHKSKALAALRIKIFPGDAYPLACCNCLNLLDIILDFKEAVTKAKNLLLGERTFLESDGWDDSDCVEAIAKCRTVVEQHKNQIDCTYQEFSKRRNESDLKVDNSGQLQATVTHLIDDVHQVISTVMEAEESSGCTDSVKTEVYLEEPSIKLVSVCEPQPETVAGFVGDGDQTSNYSPSSNSDDEDYITRRKSDKTRRTKDEFEEEVKPARKMKKTKNSEANHPKATRAKKFSKEKATSSSNKEHDPRQELCDLCGQRVCPQAAESHKNRHLGIKPYSCPAEGCELTFYSRVNQISHVKRIHSENGVPTYKCDICGRNIRGAIKVINYHKRKHMHTKSHICQFCGKGFTMRQYLKQHVTVVHTEVFPHECKYCGKKFKLKWSMLAHEKNVHEKKSQAIVTVEQQMPPCDVPPSVGFDYV
ncbi:zinc finger and SCAN domain-containing protein 12-like isoform X2 [Wyeomyia smithii]|uniref:zinc finger and SCAN domain-containing protein 12-like isoform X2 n=1 Tax=Wyeomyia smithii TaxID=174621 RepID=UPI002467FBF2|nr:zinc finger and SCAN domain-containing protein 12-like isoform X2 [Wyeomyia smithii]